MAEAAAELAAAAGGVDMSLVNRMLLDIDRRRADAGVETLGAHSDIRSVAPQPMRSAPKGRAVLVITVVFGACLLAIFAWRGWQAPSSLESAPQASRAPKELATASPLPAIAQLPPPAMAATDARQSATIAKPALKITEVVETPTLTAAVLNRSPALVPSETLKLSLKLPAMVADEAVARPVVPARRAAAAAPAGTTTFTSVPVRQPPADETVAAARALWNDGSRPAALAALRQALVAAETARNNPATVALARELARLDVADNRPQDALELLRRLEPLLGNDADAMALRGNVEQRLAMHAEAAQSYLAALRMRPADGKWMLGAAISLAAIGKLDEAQLWVERARERDAVTPNIAAYLQQLGIVGRR